MKTTEKQPTDHRPEPKPNQESLSDHGWYSLPGIWQRKSMVIAAFSIVAVLSHLLLRFGFHATPETYRIPLHGILPVWVFCAWTRVPCPSFCNLIQGEMNEPHSS